jgi:hypothetical protein
VHNRIESKSNRIEDNFKLGRIGTISLSTRNRITSQSNRIESQLSLSLAFNNNNNNNNNNYNNNYNNSMGCSIRKKLPRKKLSLLTSAAAASDAAAASVLVSPKPRGRVGRPKKTKKKQNQQDRDDRREASVEPATLTDFSLPESPVGPTFLALLSPASVASLTSSLRSSNRK